MNKQEAKLGPGGPGPVVLGKEDMGEVEKVMSGYIGDVTKTAYSNMQARFIIFLYATNENTRDLLHASAIQRKTDPKSLDGTRMKKVSIQNRKTLDG